MSPVIVLASASPRRRELLGALGVRFGVVAPDIDETPLPDESPVAYVGRLAAAKALAISADDDALVIAADTTVDLGGTILGKPHDLDDARVMLRSLSERTHRVHTGVALRRQGTTLSEVHSTAVTFVALTDAQIEWYLATEEPFDKAGAYAVQGAGGVFVRRIQGSLSNVIGLPLHAVARLAGDLGVTLLA